MSDFDKEVQARICANGEDGHLRRISAEWMQVSHKAKYSYNFSWLGRPIIQYPGDVLAMQELLWRVKPDLVIETGIAHGGSLILSASMLELNATCGGPADARVLGIDVDIRKHNQDAIEAHPLVRRIRMIEGSSIDPNVIAAVWRQGTRTSKVLVCLDSNHTHAHVLAELEAYAPLVSLSSYCVVFDTIIEELPAPADRPWGPGNSPATALAEYLTCHPEFRADSRIDDQLLLSTARGGYLERIG